MTRRLADLLRGRLLRFLLVSAAFYSAVAIATSAPTLILILNALAISVAAGVCVAYVPVVVDGCIQRSPTKGELLGTGIFFVSLSVFGMRVLSVVARDLGWPAIYNTDWTTLPIYCGLIGGLMHLWAPDTMEGRLPRGRWISTGVLVACGFALVLLLWDRHFTSGHPPVQLR